MITEVDAGAMVHKMLTRYALALDKGRFTDLAELITADFSFVLNPDGDGGPSRVNGREAAVDFIRRSSSAQDGPTKHFVSNILVKQRTESAVHFSAYLLFGVFGVGGFSLRSSGVYNGVCVFDSEGCLLSIL